MGLPLLVLIKTNKINSKIIIARNWCVLAKNIGVVFLKLKSVMIPRST